MNILPNNTDPNKYFSGYNQEGNKSLGMLKNVQFLREIFALSPVTYITVNFTKLVSDLFHASSTVIESECIKRKTRLSE